MTISTIKATAAGLSVLFLGAAIAWGTGAFDEETSNERQLCSAPLLIPSNAEEAEYLIKNAAALYDALPPTTTTDLENGIKMFEDGAEFEITGTTTGTTTLPDGSSRTIPCLTYKLTN